WDTLQRDPSAPNPLPDLLAGDGTVLAFLPEERVRSLLTAKDYTGDAPQRSRNLANIIREAMEHDPRSESINL
ncbi:MAG TPA: hypothetical protein VLY63_29875, partial [Anaerolineae bacterium]|nr:hypothetical protein [Anaerolineae bacterium]